MKTCPHCTTGYPDSLAKCPTHDVLLNEIRDLKPGMVIHKTYRIVRKIGKGGMGTVYLAEHIHMGEQRALKFLSQELSHDQALVSRFLREVRTLRQVHSPNVVECGDLEAAEDDSLFFSMEFVDGPDLRDSINHAPKPFDVQLALTITRGIADGLGAAHAKGMVHRDIKPENILMGRDGDDLVPKIADFGIVATKENSSVYTKTGGTLLTMAYAAPEQWRGTSAAELDGRTDLYALGGVLFEILTGQTVFNAENYEGWAYQHQKVTPQPPSSLRPELANWKGLDALVLLMLAKDQLNRPKNVAELLSLLGEVVYVPPTVVRPATEPEIPKIVDDDGGKKNPRRVPIWIWVPVVCLLAVTAIVTALAFSIPPTHIDDLAGGPLSKTPLRNPVMDFACTRGFVPACNDQRDYPRVVSLYAKACDGGAAEDCANLGTMYYNGLGVAQDFPRAASLYTKACDAGNAEVCNILGNMYEDGLGVSKDFSHAVSPFTKACDAGNAEGCYSLGIMYYDGIGVSQDLPRAVSLYTKACDAGDGIVCVDLGNHYRHGRGVSQDAEKARQFYKKGCSLEESLGCEDLKEMQ